MKQQLILALDINYDLKCIQLIKELENDLSWIKLGFQAYNTINHLKYKELTDSNKYNIFLDLKFHDIPSTVARNIKSAMNNNINMINIHTLGGFNMMKAAKESAMENLSKNITSPILLGVTILTSMHEDDEYSSLFMTSMSITDYIVHLAKKAQSAALDGVVCSPLEIEAVRKACGDEFIIVTPGIRPKWSNSNDHKRFITPTEAIKRGSDYIIVGRPILEANNPVEVTKRILDEIDQI